ncbi:haloacid dehalogenase [Artomyces pyxidatus]|uniref:Haloacid dehalogenase n=1 Tax=Artomyces pyxidatus TaxID=48021 RepID=A0ACB8SHJ0_9AGAM|nr:haloacid dehalogenase [Artomyces pyxidatus]
MPTTHILAFDVYGTILNTGSIAGSLKEHLNISTDKANAISTLWRTYQLEYTWRLNSMGLYESFHKVTRKSLLHAALDHGFDLQPAIAFDICEAYWKLTPYPDALDTLKSLNELPNVQVVVFSNGTKEMISSAMDAASLSPLIHTQFLADSVQKYKPMPDIYRGLVDFLGKSEDSERVYLVSGNPFDVTGARSAGLSAIWVDRAGKGWHDRLFDVKKVGPTHTVRGLKDISALVQSFQS